MITPAEVAGALERYQGAGFRYGVLDCCLFVANVLRDLVGKDYAAPWRDRYSTEFGARRIVATHNGLAGLAGTVFGKMKPIWAARPGSPVMLNPGMVEQDCIGEALGIFDGDQIVYLTDGGLQKAPITAGTGCWHV